MKDNSAAGRVVSLVGAGSDTYKRLMLDDNLDSSESLLVLGNLGATLRDVDKALSSDGSKAVKKITNM